MPSIEVFYFTDDFQPQIRGGASDRFTAFLTVTFYIDDIQVYEEKFSLINSTIDPQEALRRASQNADAIIGTMLKTGKSEEE